mgnify:CR=1 FL=1
MNNIDYKSIGRKIKEARKRNKLSQEVVAEKCNISVSFLSNIERGAKKMSLETFVSIARELNISADYLLLDNLPATTTNLTPVLEYAKENCSKEQYDQFVNIIKVLLDGIDRL